MSWITDLIDRIFRPRPRPPTPGPGPDPTPGPPGEPEDFTLMINATRREHGLPPVLRAGDLIANATRNNDMQARRGLGHHTTLANTGQCVASTANPAAAIGLWLNSTAGHREILLSANATQGAAIASDGYSTYDCRMGVGS